MTEIKGPAYSHYYATQPLELIVKTQQAKHREMEAVVKIRNYTEQMFKDRMELTLRQQEQMLSYNSKGGYVTPQATTGSKVDITI